MGWNWTPPPWRRFLDNRFLDLSSWFIKARAAKRKIWRRDATKVNGGENEDFVFVWMMMIYDMIWWWWWWWWWTHAHPYPHFCSLITHLRGMFAVITPALMTGAFADRFRFKPYLIFIVLWLLQLGNGNLSDGQFFWKRDDLLLNIWLMQPLCSFVVQKHVDIHSRWSNRVCEIYPNPRSANVMFFDSSKQNSEVETFGNSKKNNC